MFSISCDLICQSYDIQSLQLVLSSGEWRELRTEVICGGLIILHSFPSYGTCWNMYLTGGFKCYCSFIISVRHAWHSMSVLYVHMVWKNTKVSWVWGQAICNLGLNILVAWKSPRKIWQPFWEKKHQLPWLHQQVFHQNDKNILLNMDKYGTLWLFNIAMV